MLFQRLYLRIWLAVVLAVAVLTLVFGWAWRQAAEPPLRQVVVRNEQGQVIGMGQRHRSHAGAMQAEDGPATNGEAPDFVVRLQDGQALHINMPRPMDRPRFRPPFGFLGTLALVALAVALATYPIIRRLTRGLERLQQGVKQWGDGDLSIRVPETGQDEVAFLARRFNHSAEQIQALLQSKESLLASQKSLLANASHELRSPLTRIRMSLELLDGATSSSKAEIARSISELDELIGEILLASRLDTPDVDLGTVETIDILGLLAEECAHVGAALDLAPESGSGSEFWANGVSKLLRRAIRNLLENAQRHAAGDVQASLQKTERWMEIRICDRGPGVPEALRDRIFEPFFRLPGASERDGGVGLGLALVRSIALRHGGRAFCEPRAGGGACFVLVLPRISPICGIAPGSDKG